MALDVSRKPARSKGVCVSAEHRLTKSLLGWGAVAGPHRALTGGIGARWIPRLMGV